VHQARAAERYGQTVKEQVTEEAKAMQKQRVHAHRSLQTCRNMATWKAWKSLEPELKTQFLEATRIPSLKRTRDDAGKWQEPGASTPRRRQASSQQSSPAKDDDRFLAAFTEYIAVHREAQQCLQAHCDEAQLQIAEGTAIDTVSPLFEEASQYIGHFKFKAHVQEQLRKDKADRTEGQLYLWSDWEASLHADFLVLYVLYRIFEVMHGGPAI